MGVRGFEEAAYYNLAICGDDYRLKHSGKTSATPHTAKSA